MCLLQGCKIHCADHLSTLVVCDFDWTLIEANSDTLVVDALGASTIFETLQAQGLPWTLLMGKALAAAANDLGKTREDVVAACKSIQVHPSLKQVYYLLPDILFQVMHVGCNLYSNTVRPGHSYAT